MRYEEQMDWSGLINGWIFSAAMPFKSVICVIICDLMSTAHSRVK